MNLAAVCNRMTERSIRSFHLHENGVFCAWKVNDPYHLCELRSFMCTLILKYPKAEGRKGCSVLLKNRHLPGEGSRGREKEVKETVPEPSPGSRQLGDHGTVAVATSQAESGFCTLGELVGGGRKIHTSFGNQKGEEERALQQKLQEFKK